MFDSGGSHQWNFGLNQGRIMLMIENQRTGLIWHDAVGSLHRRRIASDGASAAADYDQRTPLKRR